MKIFVIALLALCCAGTSFAQDTVAPQSNNQAASVAVAAPVAATATVATPAVAAGVAAGAMSTTAVVSLVTVAVVATGVAIAGTGHDTSHHGTTGTTDH